MTPETPVVVRFPGVRVALLHPQRIWVETLESMLLSWPGIEVVVAHTTYEWVRAAVARGDVDVVLVGLDDGHTGPEQIRGLRQAWPEVAVAVISASDDAHLMATMVRAGVRGWVRPWSRSRRLVQTLRGVRKGETWLPPEVTSSVLDSLLVAEQVRVESQQAISKLSERELEILGCLAQGMTREEVGQRYRLSPHTVRTHINHVLHKLDVHSTLAAVSLVNKSQVRQ